MANYNIVASLLHPDFTALRKLGDVEMSVKVNNMVRMAFVKTEEANRKREILAGELRDLAEQLSRVEEKTQEQLEEIAKLEEKPLLKKEEKAKLKALKDEQVRRAALADGIRQKAAEKDVVVSEATAVSKRYTDDFNAYMEEQRLLFKSKGLDEYRAYHDMMIPNGEMKKPNGEILQLFKIVKRDVDLEPVEVDPDASGHALSVAASRSYSDAVGLAKEERRGKYNDGAMLINGEAANIDRAEYADWVAM